MKKPCATIARGFSFVAYPAFSARRCRGGRHLEEVEQRVIEAGPGITTNCLSSFDSLLVSGVTIRAKDGTGLARPWSSTDVNPAHLTGADTDFLSRHLTDRFQTGARMGGGHQSAHKTI